MRRRPKAGDAAAQAVQPPLQAFELQVVLALESVDLLLKLVDAMLQLTDDLQQALVSPIRDTLYHMVGVSRQGSHRRAQDGRVIGSFR
jgi:hypothetical protein